MCGIVGVIAKPGSAPLDPATCRHMCAAIEHRGPDDEGYWHSDTVSMGMRRLSIIDISCGAQPIWISDSLGIVFNGEIYNYRELRSELAASGSHFTTQSDTEVILHLYRERGDDFINHLSGMFALCIIDLEHHRVILGRDRFGEKPLYYADTGGGFYFASELKALIAGMPAMPAVNTEAVWNYLTLRFLPQPATMWNDVKKLLPGHVLVYDLAEHSYRKSAYWSTSFRATRRKLERHYEQEFKDLFYDAVNKRILASDVPVGIFLSGGLDSTLITLAAKECGHSSLHTFSIGYNDANLSELGYAREVAKYFGTIHHELSYDYSDFKEYLPRFPWDSDEPLGDSASIPLHYLSKFARRWVKVTLTGEGADELFGGYNMEHMASHADRLRPWLSNVPRQVFQVAGLLRGKHSSRGSAFLRMARNGWGDYVGARPTHPTHFWTDDEKRHIFPSPDRFMATDDLIRSWYDDIPSSDPLDKYMTVLCKSWLVEDLLMKADKMSMSASLELRCPFLDPKLAEWAQTLPLELRFGSKRNGYVSKALLRSFGKGRIPQRIIDRPKQGFPVPTYQWMSANVHTWVDSFLKPRDCALRSVLGFDYDLSPLAASAARGDLFATQKIWLLVLLELWLKQWVLKEPTPSIPELGS